MRIRHVTGKASILWVLFVTMPTGQVGGQTHDLSDNAALQYYQAFLLVDFEGQEQDVLREWHGVELDQQVDRVLTSTDSPLMLLHHGAGFEMCDWGLAGEEFGMELLLSQTDPARELMALAGLRGRRRIHDGDVRDGLVDLCAALTLARHLGAGNATPMYFTGGGEESRILEVLSRHLDTLSPADRQYLLERWDALPPVLSLAEVIEREREMMTSWLRRMVRDERLEEVYKLLGILRDPSQWNTDPGYDQAVERVAGQDSDKWKELIHRLDGYYGDLVDLVRLPIDEFEEAYAAWLAKFRREADPLSRAMVPAYGRSKAMTEKYERKREAFEAHLQP